MVDNYFFSWTVSGSGIEVDYEQLVGPSRTVISGYPREVEVDGIWYHVGYVHGEDAQTTDLPEAEFKEKVLLPELKISLKENVSNLQAMLYAEVEGKDNVNMIKAQTVAYTEAVFTDLDDIMFKKKQIRKDGGIKEAEIDAFTDYDLLLQYDYTFEIIDDPVIEFNAITVGSFLERMSADEKIRLEEFRDINGDFDKSYDALKDRTHVITTSATLHAVASLLAQANVLDENPSDSNYPDRKTELLRLASADEAFRPSFS